MTLEEICSSDEYYAWLYAQRDWNEYQDNVAEAVLDDLENDNIRDYSKRKPEYLLPSHRSYVDLVFSFDKDYVRQQNWLYGNDSNLKTMLADATSFVDSLIGTDVPDATFSSAFLYKADLQYYLEEIKRWEENLDLRCEE